MGGAALKCIHRVIRWICKAVRDGVQAGVDKLKEIMPRGLAACCMRCVLPAKKMTAHVLETSTKLIDRLEDIIRDALTQHGVPVWLCDKIDFNGNRNPDDVMDDEEPEKIARARQEDECATPES